EFAIRRAATPTAAQRMKAPCPRPWLCAYTMADEGAARKGEAARAWPDEWKQNQMSARSSAIRIALAVLLGCHARTTVLAQAAVDLELVLAVDVSGSVNQTRFELQKQGYAAAFRDARVVHAIRSGANRAITVTMVQWTGPELHVQVVPWTLIGNQTSA